MIIPLGLLAVCYTAHAKLRSEQLSNVEDNALFLLIIKVKGSIVILG